MYISQIRDTVVSNVSLLIDLLINRDSNVFNNTKKTSGYILSSENK